MQEAAIGRGRHEEHTDGRREQYDMDERAATGPQPGYREVSIEVTQEQRSLEEEEDGGPHRRDTPEDRQHEPADQQLDGEEQEGRQTDGHGPQRDDGNCRQSVDEGSEHTRLLGCGGCGGRQLDALLGGRRT